MIIKVVNHSPFARFEQNGNRVDVTCAGFVKEFSECKVKQSKYGIEYKQGAIFRVSLGFAAELPKGYEAEVVSRSSTRQKFGVMLTNSLGVIDDTYCGNNDIWMAEFIAVEDGKMNFGDRILQFKIEKTEPIEIEYVDSLENDNRGGWGSTGK